MPPAESTQDSPDVDRTGTAATPPECSSLTAPCPGGCRRDSARLDRALLVARAGDQLVVTKLDRLGRSLENLIELARTLQQRQVDLVVLDQGVDTATAVGRMFVQILGAISEFERALMAERTLDGLEAARARGRTGGQKPKLGPRQARVARQMYDEVDKNGKTKFTVATGRPPARPATVRRRELPSTDPGTGAGEEEVPLSGWSATIPRSVQQDLPAFPAPPTPAHHQPVPTRNDRTIHHLASGHRHHPARRRLTHPPQPEHQHTRTQRHPHQVDNALSTQAVLVLARDTGDAVRRWDAKLLEEAAVPFPIIGRCRVVAHSLAQHPGAQP